MKLVAGVAEIPTSLRPVLGVLAAALGFGIWQGGRSSSGDWESVLVLGALAGLFGWNSLARVGGARRAPVDRIGAWLLLAVAVLPLILLPETAWCGGMAFLLLAAALICHFGGARCALRLSAALVLCLLVIPFEEQLSLMLSYPLRLLSTMFSVETLKLFGMELHCHLTTIRVGGSEIAITDACSGITQLAVLSLLGYLVVRFNHRKTFWAFWHYLCLLPVIIMANTVRLIATILLFQAIGAKAFDDPWHSVAGYLLVIVTMVTFYLLGGLFPDFCRGEEAKAEEAK